MKYKSPLTEKELNELWLLLNDDQRKFLDKYIVQSKKSKWLEKLAKNKGIVIEEDMSDEKLELIINDWVLKNVLDGGYKKRPYQCECGQRLRFQYIVEHREKQLIYKLGETCFENYTGLSSQLLKDIKKEFYNINLERDEILIKYYNNQVKDYTSLLGEDIPIIFKTQIERGLPFSSKQLKALHKMMEASKRKREKENLVEIESSFSNEAKKFIKENLTMGEVREVLYRFQKNEGLYHYEEIKYVDVRKDIKYQIALGVPLTYKQEEIFKHRRRITDLKKSRKNKLR